MYCRCQLTCAPIVRIPIHKLATNRTHFPTNFVLLISRSSRIFVDVSNSSAVHIILHSFKPTTPNQHQLTEDHHTTMSTTLQFLRDQILANARELHFFSFPADRPYTHFEVTTAFNLATDGTEEHRAIVTKAGPSDGQIEVYLKSEPASTPKDAFRNALWWLSVFYHKATAKTRPLHPLPMDEAPGEEKENYCSKWKCTCKGVDKSEWEMVEHLQRK